MLTSATHFETTWPGIDRASVRARRFLAEWSQGAPDDLKGKPAAAVLWMFTNPHELSQFFPELDALSTSDAAIRIHHILVSLVWSVMEECLLSQGDRYSYLKLTDDDEFIRLTRVLYHVTNAASVHTMLTMLFQMMSHNAAGRRVYDVSEGLGWQLAHTELRGLTVEDLRLPYESVYITVPESAGLKVYNAESGWHRCVGVYLTEDHGLSDPHLADTLKTARPEFFKSLGVGEIGGRDWRFMAVGEDKGARQTGTPGVTMADDALSYFRVSLLDGLTIDQAIGATRYEMEELSAADRKLGWEEMSEEWEKIFRWVMNAVLYATHTEPGTNWIANKEARQLWDRIQRAPKKSKKRSALSKKYSALDPQRRILLGTGVVVDRHLLREGSPGDGSTRGPVVVRTRVSGHWRNQAHGEGRALRKLIWIEPHWRGPDDAPINSPTHQLR